MYRYLSNSIFSFSDSFLIPTLGMQIVGKGVHRKNPEGDNIFLFFGKALNVQRLRVWRLSADGGKERSPTLGDSPFFLLKLRIFWHIYI